MEKRTLRGRDRLLRLPLIADAILGIKEVENEGGYHSGARQPGTGSREGYEKSGNPVERKLRSRNGGGLSYVAARTSL